MSSTSGFPRPPSWTLLTALFLAAGTIIFNGQMSTWARDLFARFSPTDNLITLAEITVAPPAPASTFTLRDLPHHPEQLYQSLNGLGHRSVAQRLQPQFEQLLDQFIIRQGVDDNFTIRVTDSRTDSLLEVFVLEQERDAYQQSGEVTWEAIDRLRRQNTRRLVDKYEALGVPRRYITVKWGRADQVREARRNEAPTIEYEIRLAELLGLSLLSTEIGTVETFNNDQLESPAGARSRYQMMPYVLRQQGIHHYSLNTVSGRSITVREEWHPLLTMEPAFLVLRGYVNAVGHELPGISAYHAGPNNIYKIYRLFLTEDTGMFSDDATVLDAYMWGLTEGFDDVSSQTTFKTHSRGYVPTVYGSLRATESLPIDTTQTLRVERVRLRTGETLPLSQLLSALEPASLSWQADSAKSMYNKFRHLNPHFNLPWQPDSLGVPVTSDVELQASVQGMPVRFFLPLGSEAYLTEAGHAFLNPEATFAFTPDTYADPDRTNMTAWDYAYEDLVERISRFGFTEANKDELDRLVDRFEILAAINPSHYRRAQLTIIKTHQQMWSTRYWTQLAMATEAARGNVRAPVRPPVPLGE